MKKIIFTALLAVSFIATAQEEEKGTFTLSGTVDTYYSTNLSTSAIGTTGVLTDVKVEELDNIESVTLITDIIGNFLNDYLNYKFKITF